MQTIRKAIILGLAVFVANVVVFLMTVPFFLNRVHHHWIIPVYAAWLLFQSILFAQFDPSWSKPTLRVVTRLGLMMGAILFWRQFSMFQCFRQCEGRLTVGLLLLAGENAVVWRFGPFNKSRFLSSTAIVFLVWAIIVMTIGIARATWNFS